jgi:hypothetical protein
MIIEYDLCEPANPIVDVEKVEQGKAILTRCTPELIHVLMWTDNGVLSTGKKMGPGFVIWEYLRSEDPISDTDIVWNNVRYCTQSGMRMCMFFPDHTCRAHVFKLIYRRMSVQLPARPFLVNRISQFFP